MDIMSHGATGVHIPAWEDASPADVADPDAYVCRHMIGLDATVEATTNITRAFEDCIDRLETTNGRVAFITSLLAEGRVKEMILSCGYPLISRIRVL